MRSTLLEEGGGAETEASMGEYTERLFELQRLLGVVTLEVPLEHPKITPKLETHRDYLLKEMAWMAADFEMERQLRRQIFEEECHSQTPITNHWQENGTQFCGKSDQRCAPLIMVLTFQSKWFIIADDI